MSIQNLRYFETIDAEKYKKKTTKAVMAATISVVTATASATYTETSTQIADKTIVVYDKDDIMSFKESLAAKNTKISCGTRRSMTSI